MKRSVWRWLAISSLLAVIAVAETRPQYGGTLRMAMREAPMSLDPADPSQADSFARRSVTALLFDTLISTDVAGHPRPALADSWEQRNQRLQFHLRSGVKFHDGTALTADLAAASLRFSHPSWNISVEADSLIIDGGQTLLTELALPRNAIVKRDAGSTLSGTGPFHIVDWHPGKKLTLAAEENCWRGRPFLDAVEIEMNRSFRDQSTALELGRSDLVEIAPEQAQRVPQDKYRVARSSPMELWALLFTRDAPSPDDKSLREALSLSVDRGSIRTVLLQGAGQPAASILPTWIGGYGFVFSAEANIPKAKQLRSQVRAASTWTLGYDSSDPLSRLLAERIALNAKDAGLSIQPTGSSSSDVRLIKIALASSDGWLALEDIAKLAGLPQIKSKGNSVEDLYAAEQAMLASDRLIPLLHLPVSYASPAALRNWTLRADGSWDLAAAWLSTSRP